MKESIKYMDRKKMPKHIAVIMDGNGRWAKSKGLPRIMGHRSGVKAVRDIVEACAEWGIEVLTLYSFSVENWSRPKAEVEALMKLLKEYLRKELDRMVKNNIKLRTIGRIQELPEFVKKQIAYTVEKTSKNSGLILNLALNYGGRTEIIDAVKLILKKEKNNLSVLEEEINEDLFSNYLYTKGLPYPDLLIRTSGEIRISNFLLWQIAYSEIWITDVLWPDFTRNNLLEAILDFQKRERRYGGVNA